MLDARVVEPERRRQRLDALAAARGRRRSRAAGRRPSGAARPAAAPRRGAASAGACRRTPPRPRSRTSGVWSIMSGLRCAREQVGARIVAIERRELLERLLLRAAELARHGDVHAGEQVAALAGVAVLGRAAAAGAQQDAVGGAGLAASCRTRSPSGAGTSISAPAAASLKHHGHVDDEVVAAPREHGRGLDRDLHEEVAGGRAVRARLALAAQPDARAVLDAGRDRHGVAAQALRGAAPAAVEARDARSRDRCRRSAGTAARARRIPVPARARRGRRSPGRWSAPCPAPRRSRGRRCRAPAPRRRSRRARRSGCRGTRSSRPPRGRGRAAGCGPRGRPGRRGRRCRRAGRRCRCRPG